MRLLADPVFFQTVKRNSGAKRRLVNVTNEEDRDIDVAVKEIEKPDWLDIEGVFQGVALKFARKKRTPLVANLNTTHKYFPKKPVKDERVRVMFDNDEILEISITIPEIVDEIPPFRGVFAMDFGTTNSCFAFRGGDSKATKALERAKSSPEIPSVMFFHDVSDPITPRYSVGTEAKYDIKENSGATYSYILSVKRLLGQDRSFVMLDKLGGSKPGHKQEWHVEELASFIIRDLIERAEDELAQKIQHVVATFPPMFSRDRKEAIQRAFKKAFAARGTELKDEDIVLNLDEANAGAFNYIYTALLDEFRKFNVTEKTYELLSYDFGGGTTDISLVDVKISRPPELAGRVQIRTELKGLSGDAALGGDNVTLEVFKMLKLKGALGAAERRIKEIEDRKAAEAKKAKSSADDIWSSLGKKKDDDDMFVIDSAKDAPKQVEAVVDEIDPELESISNRENQNVFEGAIQTIIAEKAIIQQAIQTGKTVPETVAAVDRGQPRDQVEKRTKVLEAAIETVLPTRYALYEDKDPFKEEVARKLFLELWNEADVLKVRLSQSEGRPCKVEGILRKCAKYAGIDPVAFNEIGFELADLERVFEQRLTECVQKAYRLYMNSHAKPKGGIAVARKGAAQTEEQQNLRILLLGNSSNLPMVRRKILEVFRVDEASVIFDRGTAKTSVAAGACEEYYLRKAFGKGGLISYEPVGFLDKLPYALGVYHKDLGLVGWDTGFWPVFDRGAAVNSSVTVDERTNFLIHPDITDLPIYVDHKDGAKPQYVGYIDFRNPSGTAPVDAAAVADPNAGKFRIKLDLLPTREILATNVQTGQQYPLIVEKSTVKPEDNPFSGIF